MCLRYLPMAKAHFLAFCHFERKGGQISSTVDVCYVGPHVLNRKGHDKKKSKSMRWLLKFRKMFINTYLIHNDIVLWVHLYSTPLQKLWIRTDTLRRWAQHLCANYLNWRRICSQFNNYLIESTFGPILAKMWHCRLSLGIGMALMSQSCDKSVSAQSCSKHNRYTLGVVVCIHLRPNIILSQTGHCKNEAAQMTWQKICVL